MRPNAKNMKTNFLNLRNFGRKRPKNKQKSMKKHVFTDTARLKRLENALPIAAQRVAAAGDAMRAQFPALPWNTRALWVLAFEPAAREYLCNEILQRAADAAGMPCEWGREDYTPKVVNIILPDEVEHPAPLSEETKFNRRLIMMQTKEARAPFLGLDAVPELETLLRTGVLSIGKKGETITAPDAAERLEDFCTLYAETDAQATFVENLEGMRKAAADMSAAYLKTLAGLPAQARKELAANAGFYMPNLGAIASGGQIRLAAEDANARALISFFGLARPGVEKAPKFYNRAGVWDYTAEDANALIPFGRRGLQKLGLSRPAPGSLGVTIYPAIL